MKAEKKLFLSQHEIFKLRSIARSFNFLKRKVLVSSTGEKYYSFDEVILSTSEFDLLGEIEALNPLDYD